MIKVNLLPFRAAKRIENIRRQISIYFLSIILLISIMGFFYWRQTTEFQRLREEEKRLNLEFHRYQKILKKVSILNKKIKEIQTRLNVIEELSRKKRGPVRLLDEICMAVPKDQLWLTQLNESGGKLTLKGIARDNEVVAKFMVNLERTYSIRSVDLDSTSLTKVSNYKLVSFSLQCKTIEYKEKAKKTRKKKKRKR